MLLSLTAERGPRRWLWQYNGSGWLRRWIGRGAIHSSEWCVNYSHDFGIFLGLGNWFKWLYCFSMFWQMMPFFWLIFIIFFSEVSLRKSLPRWISRGSPPWVVQELYPRPDLAGDQAELFSAERIEHCFIHVSFQGCNWYMISWLSSHSTHWKSKQICQCQGFKVR